MIRICLAFDFNALAGCKARIPARNGTGGAAAAGNRPFTMPQEWRRQARGRRRYRRPAARPRYHLSVRL